MKLNYHVTIRVKTNPPVIHCKIYESAQEMDAAIMAAASFFEEAGLLDKVEIQATACVAPF